jgi:hypothetical protein
MSITIPSPVRGNEVFEFILGQLLNGTAPDGFYHKYHPQWFQILNVKFQNGNKKCEETFAPLLNPVLVWSNHATRYCLVTPQRSVRFDE